MKTFKMSNTILSVCEAVVGILLLVNPVGFTTGIIVFLGIVLLLLGVSDVVRYFREDPAAAAIRKDLSYGCLLILAGLFCILKNGWFVATFPILTVLYGVGTLVTGITKVQWAVDRIRLGIRNWFWTAISAVLTILFAVVILCDPFSSTTVLWSFIAVILIVEAAMDIIAAVLSRKSKN